RADTQETKAVGGGGVGSCVRRKSQVAVGVDRVLAVLLEHVRTELVHEPDSAPFVVSCIDKDAAPFCCDLARRLSKLGATIAAKRSECVTGQALGVEPGQDRPAVADLPTHEREIHLSGSELERTQFELSECGAERQ